MKRSFTQIKSFYNKNKNLKLKWHKKASLDRVNWPSAGTRFLPVVVYGHKHDLEINHEFETVKVNDGLNSIKGNWRTHMLTYVGKNQQQLERFQNNIGAFEGLILIDWESKKVFVLEADVNRQVRLKRLTSRPINLPWLLETALFGEDIPLRYED